MINLFLPTLFGLYYLQKKAKMDVFQYIYYYSIINIFTNAFMALILFFLKYKINFISFFDIRYIFVAIIVSLLVSSVIIFIKQNIKIMIKKGE